MSRPLAKVRFKDAFPQTFLYLQKYVHHRYKSYELKGIPDPVVLVKGSPGFFDFTSKNAVAHYNPFSRKIVVYLDRFLQQDKAVMGRPRRISEIATPKNIISLMDKQPRFQLILIHEYEHCLQGNSSKEDYLAFATSKEYIGQFDMVKGFWNLLLGTFNFKRKLKVAYPFLAEEVEARLAERVFMRYMGYDEAYSDYLDRAVGQSEERLRGAYAAMSVGIKELEIQPLKNRRKLRILHRSLSICETYIRFLNHISEEANRIVTEMKKDG